MTSLGQGPDEEDKKSELHKIAQCLIDIDDSYNPLYKKALEVTTDNANKSEIRMEQLQRRIDGMNTTIFQAVGFFLVFQSVLITMVAQSTFLKRGNLWCPITLSISASVTCLIYVWLNGMTIALLRGDKHYEEITFKVAAKARNDLRRLGKSYSFPFTVMRFTKRKRPTYIYFLPYGLVSIFIISFTLLVLLSQWRILSSA